MTDRMCDSCGAVDDHPRHVHGLGPGEEPTPASVAAKALRAAVDSPDYEAIVAHTQDKETQMKHHDCCLAEGCPTGSCGRILSGEAAELKGEALRAHLQSGAVDHIGKELTDEAYDRAMKAQEKELA